MKTSEIGTFQRKKFSIPARLVRETIFAAWIQLLLFGPSFGNNPAEAQEIPWENRPVLTYQPQEILERSQVSYRAEGGFSDIDSYGVIISCVKGKISILRTVRDPKIPNEEKRIHKISTISTDDYLSLWESLSRIQVMKMKDAPPPVLDLLEEFTHTFNIQIGSKNHEFKVFGINRPEASAHFAAKSMIDKVANMEIFWDQHDQIVRR